MERLITDVQSLIGYTLNQRQISALKIYEQELLKWNSKFNLTAIRDIEGIRTKHFLDSISCLLAFRDNPPAKLIDIGTGAGFPGILIKIMYPALQLSLVESVGKKTQFCRHIVNMLDLTRVEVIQQRAEELGHLNEHREKYDWAVARSVANLPTLVEYLLPFVKIGGAILAQKGENGPAEVHQASHAIQVMGGSLRQVKSIVLPGVAEERYLIIIDKIAACPPQFPRRAGIPSKRPL